ncbi:MAG: hypothetical protein QM776_14555 [Rhodocyclaceae bacterium]
MKTTTSMKRNKLLVAIILFTTYGSSQSFELTPLPTKAEAFIAKRKYGIVFRTTYPIVEFGLHAFSTPVHEALTQLGHLCSDTIDDCSDINLDFANTGLIAGVRWNDDPPFQFGAGQGRYRECPSQKEPPDTISFALSTRCWYAHFKDVSAIAEKKRNAYLDGNGTLLARSHFGDLQFLHAMAPKAGVSPRDTKAKLLMWAEFTWRIQSKKEDYIPSTTKTGEVPISGFLEHFPKSEGRTIEELFAVGRPWLKLQIEDVAFGSLLHVVEDSFAGGHVKREKSIDDGCGVPMIVEFHTYAGQDKSAHKEHDKIEYARQKPELINVLRELVARST